MNTLINIFGPSTAGKSTTTELLQKHIPDLRLVDFDPIKRQIPDYHWKLHGQQGRDMTLAELTRVTQTDAPIVLLYPPPKGIDEYEKIAVVAKMHNYAVYNVEVTAPYDVLIERYRQRMANIDPAKKSWKFKTPDEFAAKLQEPYFRPEGTYTYDSSRQNPDEIVADILTHLNFTD